MNDGCTLTGTGTFCINLTKRIRKRTYGIN